MNQKKTTFDSILMVQKHVEIKATRLEQAFKTCRDSNQKQWEEAANCETDCQNEKTLNFVQTPANMA